MTQTQLENRLSYFYVIISVYCGYNCRKENFDDAHQRLTYDFRSVFFPRNFFFYTEVEAFCLMTSIFSIQNHQITLTTETHSAEWKIDKAFRFDAQLIINWSL